MPPLPLALFPVLLASLFVSEATGASPPTVTARRLIVTAPAPPSAQDIVNRALASDDQRRQHRQGWRCDQVITTERLDASGEVFKSKVAHRLHQEGDALAFSHDADLSGHGDESRGHHHRDGDTAKAEHRLALLDLRPLAPRFRYTLDGEAEVRGRTCYVVAFAPPAHPLPADTREERVINHLQGRFWIDKRTFEILQGEGSLAAPVSLSLLGSVSRLDFALSTQTLPNSEVGPAGFRIDLVVKAPFHFYRQQQTTRLENWLLASADPP